MTGLRRDNNDHLCLEGAIMTHQNSLTLILVEPPRLKFAVKLFSLIQLAFTS